MTKSWVVIVALCLSLTGCAGDGDLGAVSGKAASASPGVMPTTTPTPVPSAEPPASEPPATGTVVPDCRRLRTQKAILEGTGQTGPTLKFGQTREWSNGLKVAVTEPETFTPTPQAAGVEGAGTPLRLFVTVINSGSAPFVGADLWPTFTAGPGEASQVFDIGQCLEGRSRDEIPAGENVTYALAYVAGDPTMAKMEIDPGMQLDPVTFTN